MIELLVVVLIIGILAAVALPKYQVAVAKTKTSLAISQLAQIMQAQERYFMDTGKYSPEVSPVWHRTFSGRDQSAGERSEGISVRSLKEDGE